MTKLTWDSNDFPDEQDASGVVSGLVDRTGNLEQGYEYGNLNKGLVAYYPFEFTTDITAYDAALDKHGKLEGDTSYDSTNVQVGSNSMSFGGVDGVVDIPNNFGIFDGTQDFTISCWFNSSDLGDGNQNRIITFGGERFVTLTTDLPSAGDVSLRINDGGNNFYATTSTPSSGNWYHITGTYESGNNIKLWLDGSLEDTNNNSPTPTTQSNDSLIGARRDRSFFFDGNIDDMRIYNRLLTQPEIETLANKKKTTAILQEFARRTNLELQYKFDDSSDSTTAIDSANGNDGTINGATYASPYLGDNSLSFDGSNDYVDITTPLISQEGFGVSAWIKADSIPSDSRIITLRPDVGVALTTGRATTDYGFFFDNSSTDYDFANVTTGEWNHIAYTWDSGTSELSAYLNNNLETTISDSLGTASGQNRLCEDKSLNDFHFPGDLDEVRIYSGKLSTSDISELYYQGKERISRNDVL